MIAPTIEQEVFPNIELDVVNATIVYPGAGPSEVEKSICVPMEQAVYGLNNIDKMTCNAAENIANLTIELSEGANLDLSLQEIRNQIESIQGLPLGAETPTVTKVVRERQIVGLMLSGPLSEPYLYKLARKIEDQISSIEEVGRVTMEGVKETELVIEFKPETLAQYGLTLARVAQTLRSASLDLPAGSIQTKTGALLLRSIAKKDTPEEFAQIVIVTKPDGAVVTLGQLAKIEERIEEKDDFLTFDGKAAVYIKVFQKDGFTPKEVATKVQAYMDQKQDEFPEAIKLTLWSDYSAIFNDRFALLIKNATIGLALVFIILALFLEIHLAFWVMLGIPISFMGSLILLPMFGVSINMISLFAFILVLGIVVDDAIVIGENVYQKIEAGMPRLQAAIQGTKEMAPAVTFAILTTIVAFSPLMFIAGTMGRFMMAIPVIVMSVLAISLVEALVILPAHLAKKPGKNWAIIDKLERVQQGADKVLKNFTYGPFTRLLRTALKYRYATVSLGIVSLILSAALVSSGILPVRFFPSIESDEVKLTVALPTGYPRVRSEEIIKELESIGKQTLAKIDLEKGEGKNSFEHSYSKFIAQDRNSGASATIKFRLKPAGERSISALEFGRRWRKAVDQTPEILSMSLSDRGMHFGADISIALSHPNQKTLAQATEETKTWLAGFTGVVDIDDSEKAGKREMQFRLTNQARSMGITPQSFADDLRNAFFGLQVSILQRDKQEVKVQLRYPKSVREDLNNLERLRIRSANGGEITLAEAATLFESQEPIAIRRTNRQRVVQVNGSIESSVKNPDDITSAIKTQWIPQLKLRYPGLDARIEGRSEDRAKSMKSLLLSFLFAMFFIYALLAVFFRSYNQPIVVMLAIPFGISGAVIGHLVLGYALSFLSLFGLIGLSGVVVNDSLILVDAVNRNNQHESGFIEALVQAAASRLRPIVMTSVTTFCGLMPMLLETSRQAQFMVPMAISLGFGIMFATVITLILVPSFYLIEKDFQDFRKQKKPPVTALESLPS